MSLASSRLQIAVVTPTENLGPYIFAKRVAQALGRDAHFSVEFHCAGRSDPREFDSPESQDNLASVSILLIPSFVWALRPIAEMLYWFGLLAYVLARVARRIQLILTNNLSIVGASCVAVARLLGRKSIVFVCGLWFLERSEDERMIYRIRRRTILKFTERLILRYADLIVSPDWRAHRYLATRVPRQRLVLWDNCNGLVDTEEFVSSAQLRNDMRHELGIDSESCVLVYCGKLAKSHGADVAFDLFQRLVLVEPNLTLILIGDGPLRKVLENRLDASRSKHVIFTGHVVPNEVRRYLMTADIGIVPRKEPQCGPSMPLLEMMALGIPVIATDVDGIHYLIENNVTGFLVREDDAPAMLEHALDLIRNPSLRKRLGDNARLIIDSRFSYDSYVMNFTKLCEILGLEAR